MPELVKKVEEQGLKDLRETDKKLVCKKCDAN